MEIKLFIKRSKRKIPTRYYFNSILFLAVSEKNVFHLSFVPFFSKLFFHSISTFTVSVLYFFGIFEQWKKHMNKKKSWNHQFLAADIMINETRTYGKFDPLISPSLLHDGVVKIRRMDECRRSRYEFQIAQCKLKADLCFEVCQEAGQRCLELCEVARNELEFCNRLEWTEEGRREMEESWERLRKTNMCTKSVASNFELVRFELLILR